MNNKEAILAICSEFSEVYGFDVSDLERLVVYTEPKYINELRFFLAKQNYKIFSYQVYDKKAVINFIPENNF